jgi:hypothetical protein
MQTEINSLQPDELILLFHQINSELRKNLIDGASWEQQQERISMLSEISKELTRRKIELNENDTVKQPGHQ